MYSKIPFDETKFRQKRDAMFDPTSSATSEKKSVPQPAPQFSPDDPVRY